MVVINFVFICVFKFLTFFRRLKESNSATITITTITAMTIIITYSIGMPAGCSGVGGGVCDADAEGTVPYPIGVYCSFVANGVAVWLVFCTPPIAYKMSSTTARARPNLGVGMSVPEVHWSVAGS